MQTVALFEEIMYNKYKSNRYNKRKIGGKING
jgi:hypothetical protein